MKIIDGGVTAAKGFKAAGMHAGIKKGTKKDMAKDGTILRPETGHCAPLVRPGYPKEFLEELVKATGGRYKMK